MTIVVDLHYLPSLAWFCQIEDADIIILEKHEHYVKQSYRTRSHINTEHGRDVLNIPVRSTGGKTPMGAVEIDHTQKWVTHHWRTLQSAYGKAPFYEHYADDLKSVLYSKTPLLFDLNKQLLTMCLRWLHKDVMLEETLAYEKTYANDVLDCRNAIDVKNPVGVKAVYQPIPYYQVFGNTFVENLSIVDLIFCCGPEAGSIIKSSSRKQ